MQTLDLQRLESNVWRGNQHDGLFDLFFGSLFLGIAMSQLADQIWHNGAVTLIVLTCLQFGGALALWLARRTFTQPRIGTVRFASLRRRRILRTRAFLVLCVGATLALVVLTATSTQEGGLFRGPMSRTTVSAVASGLILTVLAALALLQEFPRLLVHAVLFAGAEFGGTWLEQGALLPFPRVLTFGVAAVVSSAIGITLLRRFLQRKPVELADLGTEREDSGHA